VFRSSTSLAGAYGLAVNFVMVAVAMMVMVVARQKWQWSIAKVIRVFFVFVLIDFAFLGANLNKLLAGGWIPLLFAMVFATVMLTWHKGMAALRASQYTEKTVLTNIANEPNYGALQQVPNLTAIFVTDPYDQSGGCLLHYLKLNRIMPEHVLLVSVIVERSPYVQGANRFILQKFGNNTHHLTLHIGFMESPNIPVALSAANQSQLFPFQLDVKQVAFLIEIPHITATHRKKTLTFFWQERLFSFLMRNAVLDIEFFKLPYNQTMAIGTYYEI
jgi:KUP system potassium uptake protein